MENILNFNIRRLERYLVMVNDAGIEPIVLLSKSDLLSPESTEEKVGRIHEIMPRLPVHSFSNMDAAGTLGTLAHFSHFRHSIIYTCVGLATTPWVIEI